MRRPPKPWAPGWLLSRAVLWMLAASVVLAEVGAPSARADVGAITEYPIPGLATPYGIASGPDGNVWFTDSGNAGGGSKVGHMTTGGVITASDVVSLPGTPNQNGLATGIAPGPDGNLWLGHRGAVDKVPTTVTLSSQITEYPFSGGVQDLLAGPDNRMWLTSGSELSAQIGAMTTDGTATTYPNASWMQGTFGITIGPDGNLWVGLGNAIGVLNTSGAVVHTYPMPSANDGNMRSLVLGPDGNVWFTLANTAAGPGGVGKITPTGTVTIFTHCRHQPQDTGASPSASPSAPTTESGMPTRQRDWIGAFSTSATSAADVTTYPTNHSNTGLLWITRGSDGRMWFNEFNRNALGAITTGGSPPPQTFNVSVSKPGSGSGTVTSTPAGITCGSTCSADFTSGTSVTVTAAAGTGSTFAGWSGGGCSGSGSCTFTVNADTAITATFDAAPGPPSAAITTPPDGASYSFGANANASYSCSAGANGGVLKTGAAGCSGPVPNGSPIDTATAGAHTFTVTATDTDGQTASATSHYTVQSPAPVTHTLSVTKSGGGSGAVSSSPAGIDCGGTCSHAYDDGTSVTLSATPAAGSTFAGWSGGGCTGSGGCTVTISADRTVSATFDQTGGSVTPPGPPSAAITTPADGASYPFAATVNASYSCSAGANGGVLKPGADGCSGSVPNGSPIDTLTFGTHTFTVTATDTDGQTTTKTAQYTLTYDTPGPPAHFPTPVRPQGPLRTIVLSPRVDIRVTGIDVTQGVQDLSCNCVGTLPERPDPSSKTPGRATYAGVTMAAGKYTVVRVFAHASNLSDPAASGLSGATATLRIFDSHEREISPPLSPNISPATLSPPDCAACVRASERANARAAFTFFVPWDDTYHRSLSFRATVSPGVGFGAAVQCSGCHANVFTLTGVPFVTTAEVPIYPVPLTLGGVKTSATVDQVFDSAAIVLPVNLEIHPYDAPLAVDGLPSVSAALAKRASDDSLDGSQAVVGVAPESFGFGGSTDTTKILYGAAPPIAYVPDDRPLSGAMHEIGHELGLKHADTGSGPDATGPHPDGTPDCTGNSGGQVGEAWPPDDEGRIQGIGFDLRSWSARILVDHHPKLASRYYDFMSYCPGPRLDTIPQAEADHWISVRNWNRLIAFHPPVQGLPVAKDARSAGTRAGGEATLRVIATVDYGGKASIFDVAPGRTLASPTAGSPYLVELRNAAGATLASAIPATTTLHNDGHRPGLLLEATLPFAPSATALVVSAGGVELARRTRSTHAPTAAIVSPRPRTRIGRGPRTLVRWQANDSDGDRLTTTVDYSADGGRHWKVVGSSASASSARVPNQLLSASRNARFRVRVSDGFDVATAISGVLRAAGARPVVHIIGGAPRGRMRADAMLLLRGAAFDDAGNRIAGRSLRWYAGRRLLGRGTLLTVPGLAAGTTAIRLVATDRHGRSSQARLPIRVLAVPPAFLVARAPGHVSPGARRVRVVVASTVPATLRIAGKRYAVNRKPRVITIPIRRGRSILRLAYTLRARGGATRGTYLAAR